MVAVKKGEKKWHKEDRLAFVKKRYVQIDF